VYVIQSATRISALGGWTRCRACQTSHVCHGGRVLAAVFSFWSRCCLQRCFLSLIQDAVAPRTEWFWRLALVVVPAAVITCHHVTAKFSFVLFSSCHDGLLHLPSQTRRKRTPPASLSPGLHKGVQGCHHAFAPIRLPPRHRCFEERRRRSGWYS
jgi:hypothetical protein